MKNRICIAFTVALHLLLVSVLSVHAQDDLLTVDEAIQLAIDNNYKVSAAGISKAIAEKNASKFNDGSLPAVSASAGATYNFDHSKNKVEGIVTEENKHTFPFSAGVNMRYTLYDQGRSQTRQQLAGLYDLSDLQLRQTIELLLVDLLTSYWRVAQLEQNIVVKIENLAISQRNLLRSEYAFDYGVTSKLGVLNNEVNVNNDSIVLQTAILEYENAKRDLNILMGRDAQTDFSTETDISFIGDFNLDQLRADASSSNIFILMGEQNIALDQIAMDLTRTGWFPTVDLNGGYNWRQTPYVNNPIDYLGNHGLSGGVGLTWNIFDGGRTKTAVERSKLSMEDSRLYKEEIIRQVDRDVMNGFATYQTALYVVEAQRKNIETSERNFERTQEQFKLGNITTTTFREAQTNLLNARLGLLQALYQAKVSEIQLLQIAGRIAD